MDQLGAFLLTAMEDLRKRKNKLAKLPHTKPLPRNKQTGEMLVPDIPCVATACCCCYDYSPPPPPPSSSSSSPSDSPR